MNARHEARIVAGFAYPPAHKGTTIESELMSRSMDLGNRQNNLHSRPGCTSELLFATRRANSRWGRCRNDNASRFGDRLGDIGDEQALAPSKTARECSGSTIAN